MAPCHSCCETGCRSRRPVTGKQTKRLVASSGHQEKLFSLTTSIKISFIAALMTKSTICFLLNICHLQFPPLAQPVAMSTICQDKGHDDGSGLTRWYCSGAPYIFTSSCISSALRWKLWTFFAGRSQFNNQQKDKVVLTREGSYSERSPAYRNR